MTLCIAVKARDWSFESEPIPGAIVLCSDSLATTEISNTEHVSKLEWLPHGFVAMIAGTIHTAREFVGILRRQMKSTPMDVRSLIDRLRRSVQIQKYQFADAYIGARLGISYKEFREHGSAEFPEDLYRDLSWNIRNHCLDVDLIVAGFVDREAVVLKLCNEDVLECDKFGCIGSGATLAEASLMQRDYISIADVSFAVYLAYEAKRNGERSMGVGHLTTIWAMLDRESGTIVEVFRPESIPALDREYKRFGPRKVAAGGLKPLPQNAWYRVVEPNQAPTTAAPSPPQPLPALPEGSDES